MIRQILVILILGSGLILLGQRFYDGQKSPPIDAGNLGGKRIVETDKKSTCDGNLKLRGVIVHSAAKIEDMRVLLTGHKDKIPVTKEAKTFKDGSYIINFTNLPLDSFDYLITVSEKDGSSSAYYNGQVEVPQCSMPLNFRPGGGGTSNSIEKKISETTKDVNSCKRNVLLGGTVEGLDFDKDTVKLIVTPQKTKRSETYNVALTRGGNYIESFSELTPDDYKYSIILTDKQGNVPASLESNFTIEEQCMVTPQFVPKNGPVIPPKEVKKVKTIVIQGKHVPYEQVYIGTGTDCDAPHYHAQYQGVTSIEGPYIEDPEGCGYGKVSEVPIVDYEMQK